MFRRILISVFVVALVASLASDVALFMRQQQIASDLASLRAAAADETSKRRDAQAASAAAEEALADAQEAQDNLKDELEQQRAAAQEEIEALEAQVAELEEAEAQQKPAAADHGSREAVSEDDSGRSDPEPSPTATEHTEDPCDELGGFHELGPQGCADSIAEMEACWGELSNDPDWVQLDGARYENTVTGEITTCDI